MPRPRNAQAALTVPQAALLGIVHGPAELLPVSSSAHTALIPWLLRWPAAELDADLRKSLEVALHAGAGIALALDERGGARPRRAELGGLVLSVLAPAAVGYLFEEHIERRLCGPRAVATCLLAGSAAMWLADPPARERGRGRGRGRREADALDWLLLGLAQATALLPGISRSGATLTAARLRGFAAADARELSRATALPVIAGASTLKTWRLRARGVPRGFAGALAAAAASSLASTLLALRLQARRAAAPGPGSLRPYALYRSALALLIASHREASQGMP